MAFAAEQPVLSHSEHRPVGEIERTEGRFEVISDYEPAGDQPQAIKELDERLSRGRKALCCLARRVRVSRRRGSRLRPGRPTER